MRDLSVVEIARAAGTSPATFYQYFKDVGEATLRLAEQAADEMPAVLELIDRPWDGEGGLANARAIVEAFVRHWDTHRAVLLVRNLAADEGDRRFMRVRQEALTPVLEHLAAQIAAGQRGGPRRPASSSPRRPRPRSAPSSSAWPPIIASSRRSASAAPIWSRPARASCTRP